MSTGIFFLHVKLLGLRSLPNFLCTVPFEQNFDFHLNVVATRWIFSSQTLRHSSCSNPD